jgi:nitroimidazol reductase NimA-like FMN-containing flavoprotein (pyridoxamine 5'-phosphate oxidase superfamily)
MKYDNSEMRRKKIMDESQAKELLNIAEYGTLSMLTSEEVYAVPMSFVWDKELTIYFHCALEGKKIDCIKKNPNVCFSIVGNTMLIPEKFSTKYESLIFNGKVEIVSDEAEKMRGLQLLVKKYSFNFQEGGHKYAKSAMAKTGVLKLKVEKWSGKTNY